MMKHSILSAAIVLSLCGSTFAAETDHKINNGPVTGSRPWEWVEVTSMPLWLGVDYMVVGKTEIQNFGAANNFTCNMRALYRDINGDREVSYDLVSAWVPSGGAFTGMPFNIVVPKQYCGGTNTNPALCNIRVVLRCANIFNDLPTHFVVRQTKITAHASKGITLITVP